MVAVEEERRVREAAEARATAQRALEAEEVACNPGYSRSRSLALSFPSR